MTREHTVAVRVKPGSGSVAFGAGQRYALKLKENEVATKWLDDSPITRAEFETILKPTELFEIVVTPQTAGTQKKGA